ncbi:hypothetical protein [Nannocystis pusilla]|uniref:hypothetical protein n=1 Tax=Nannocystis pusilla TaxID=889268 RepID=UPI003B787665
MDAAVAEADDVGAAVGVDVGEEARVAIDAPAAGDREVVEPQLGRLELAAGRQ